MNKLTEAHLISINQSITQKEGQPFKVLSDKSLNAIVNEPFTIAPGDNVYKHTGIVDKAAVYGSFLAKMKPFSSCNIRTAIVTIITFLRLNDIELLEYQDDLDSLADCLKRFDDEAAKSWILDHMGSKKPVFD